MRNTIIRVWNGEAKFIRWVLYIPLAFFSYLYQIGLYAREYMYKSGLMKTERAVIPVISVGNIALGGTGKTPVVEKLSKRLKEEGLNPGIITRGYKRKKKGIFSVDIKNDTVQNVGDEAFMLAKRTNIPVVVGKDRLAAIEYGIGSSGIDIAILDDGFQVKKLAKDIELLILKGSESFEKHELFPLGPYREPLARIRDSHAVLVNKGNLDKSTLYFTHTIPKFHIRYKPLHLYNMKRNLIAHYRFLKGKRIVAFSGLGDNHSFFNLLRDIGADIVHEISFPDHHRYTEKDLRKCSSREGIDCIVTTEKDAVKIAYMDLPEDLFYLSIEAVIEDEKRLIAFLLKKIGVQPRGSLNSEIRSQRSQLVQ
jgi:tetraacyldisaccharide 4'-kinase